MTTVVYCKKEGELRVRDIQRLLTAVDVSRVSTQTARKPKGGEIYIYECGNTTRKIDWLSDGYCWLNAGCDRLPRRQPVVYKRKFQIVKAGGSSSEFKRVAYSELGPYANRYILVHYIGDETVAGDLLHGNVKNRKETPTFQRGATSDFEHRAAEVKGWQPLQLHQSPEAAEDNTYNKPYNLGCGGMVKTCVVKGCRSRTSDGIGCRFFCIPAVPRQHDEEFQELYVERQREWIIAAGYDPSEFELKKHHRICSNHFVSGQPSRAIGNVDWIPTLKIAPQSKTDSAMSGTSMSHMRWTVWLREVDHITKFLKTGEICSTCQLSEADQIDLVQSAQKYYIENGTLYFRKSGRTQKVVMTKDERDAVLDGAHVTSADDNEGKHADSKAMWAAIEPHYKWPHIKLDADEWISRCKQCTPSAVDRVPSDKEADDSLTHGCADAGVRHDAIHGTLAATPGGQVKSTTVPLPGGSSTEKLATKPLSSSTSLQPKKLHGSAVVQAQGSSKVMANKVMLVKHSLTNTTTSDQTPVPSLQSGDKNVSVLAKKKSVRPVAWLLHTIGLRMVREKVYDDLIEVQEEKDLEGTLGSGEQRQLGRLRGAYSDMVKQNKPFTVRTKRRCRCGFSARIRLELELHRDYGSISDDSFRYACCLCNLQNIRSPGIIAAHIERAHGRQSRIHTIPPTGFCPYCPFEQRTYTKCKLSRHVINCALTFRIDRNLAPTAADADIPLFEILHPPASSVQASPAASAAGLISSSSVFTDKTPVSSAVPGLSSGCTTVTAAGPVMTPAESQAVTSSGKIPLAKLARLMPLPEGLGFEVCELCGAFLASRESLVVHMSRAHKMVLPAMCLRAEKPAVSCEKCSERFWTAVGLDVHVSQMHGGQTEPASPPTTVCPLCKRTRLTDVLEHLARQHRITLVDMFAQRYCSICQLTLHAAHPFEYHMLSRHSDIFPDRASLYTAIVMVDRATRGRAGMVGHGRQPAVLSGAASRPCSKSSQPGSHCTICRCKFADEEKVEEHVRQAHGFMCMHCGRKCTSREFLNHHVQTVHSTDTVSCRLCSEEVGVLAMAEHLENRHVQPCAVNLSPLRDSLTGQDGGLERKRRRGSQSSDSIVSSNDDEITDEPEPAAKKLKTL